MLIAALIDSMNLLAIFENCETSNSYNEVETDGKRASRTSYFSLVI